MRIATWNINSVRARLDLLLDWMEAHDPDVLCLQETKVVDQEFPEDEFGDLDYDVEYFGERSYNGVAIASHDEPTDVFKNLPTDGDDAQARVISAEVAGVRFIDVYCPNGKALGSDQYDFKIDWYARLRTMLDEKFDPSTPIVLCGDFNICPQDHDAWEDDLVGGLFLSEPERAAYQNIIDFGFTDAFRHLHPDVRKYTWWDYRGSGYQRNLGLRIDHFLITAPVLERLESVEIHADMRGVELASDHAPVVLTLSD